MLAGQLTLCDSLALPQGIALFDCQTQALDAVVSSNGLDVQVAASLEKVDGRERQLNGQFDGLMVQYQDTRQQLLAAQEEYNRCAAATACHCSSEMGLLIHYLALHSLLCTVPWPTACWHQPDMT
jgi:hypothetical protein